MRGEPALDYPGLSASRSMARNSLPAGTSALTTRFLVAALLVAGVTVLQRLSVSAGGFQFPFVFFIVYATMGILYWKRIVAFSSERVILLSLILALFVASALFAEIAGSRYGAISYPALGWMIVLYLPFMLVLRAGELSFLALLARLYLYAMFWTGYLGHCAVLFAVRRHHFRHPGLGIGARGPHPAGLPL